ncbi:MAG: PIN domain-containing protein [Chloroflexi bacterium CFX4]|nr:PIN domain-containing protein [Chloroflexi bacterium CFX4]MDL1921414.1 PIN domain-containing protein [Chloroflexi bacterium CFX3]
MIDVRATVIDLRTDQPRATDVFLVDTNVWLWACYASAEYADQQPYQTLTYPPYLRRAKSNGARLAKSAITWVELAHLIERLEWKIFRNYTGETPDLKTYRQAFPEERQRVVQEFEGAWRIAEDLSNFTTLPLSLDIAMLEKLAQDYQFLRVDGYDLLIYHAALSAGIRQILTDDVDYGEFPDVQIFTANLKLINIAREQGKLVTR